MDFKVIAIKPLKGCNKKFLKVLKWDECYWLYKGYRLEGDELLSPDPSEVIDLYSSNGIKINISAIVGKNGSGKSSLLELMYVALFNMAVEAKILPKKNDFGEEIKIEDNIRVELYCQFDTSYVKIKVFDKAVLIKYLNSEKAEFPITAWRKSEVANLFYLISINYSHHSLNETHLGVWLKNVFHKNDGYQTPLVLNPYREQGNIDINSEDYLTRARLISNLIITVHASNEKDYIKSVRTLIPNKTVTHVKFKFDKTKQKKMFDKEDEVNLTVLTRKKEVIEILENKFPKLKTRSRTKKQMSIAGRYLLRKLYFISTRYEPFVSKYRYLFTKDFSVKKLQSFILDLEKSESHTTFKIKQAFTFLKNPDFYIKNANKWIPIDELNKYIVSLTNDKSDIINFLPPSFFEFDLKFEDRELFNNLSSGEKHKIYSTASYKYHLYNLDSVQASLKYNSVLLIFDEIELYYHPDLQRSFVADFLEAIANIRLRRIKSICCIMSTHSPFILSDIPSENILALTVPGDKSSSGEIRTFGANIHDLLKNSFFLGDGFMGKFAQEKINSAISFLNNNSLESTHEWNKEIINKFIEIVSEPIIRKSLRYAFKKKYLTNSEIDDEIKSLQSIKNGRT